MFDIQKLIRKNILDLKPYSTARDDFSFYADIFLDANENPYDNGYNRYPDPYQKTLKIKISEIKNIHASNIYTGNGSDEMIDLLIRVFCEPKTDHIIVLPPTYGMYEVAANINDVAVKKINLNSDFQPQMDEILQQIDINTKLIFICSPNNPSGNIIDKQIIVELLNKFSGIVVVDEAYIDFCEQLSVLQFINTFPNLFVMQTFSKAWGLAGIRLGIGFSNAEIINILNKVKYPYNVNNLSKQKALEFLNNLSLKNNFVKIINLEKQNLIKELQKLNIVEKIFPSEANFILVKFKTEANEIYNKLISKGIVVRNRSNQINCENCLRITTGKPEENRQLLRELFILDNQIFNNTNIQTTRNTKETNVFTEINLQSYSEPKISTGIGFFDHMLTQISVHAQITLNVLCYGDLNVDEHHSVEDTAIALGNAFAQALGDKTDIERYGFFLPMDDANAQVAIDFGGRNSLQWNVRFMREKIGDFPTEMFEHFFKSFSDSAKCNVYIKAEGENEHHKIEAVFKAFARSLKQAVKKTDSKNGITSSKGII